MAAKVQAAGGESLKEGSERGAIQSGGRMDEPTRARFFLFCLIYTFLTVVLATTAIRAVHAYLLFDVIIYEKRNFTYLHFYNYILST
jgi:hypothetical protein